MPTFFQTAEFSSFSPLKTVCDSCVYNSCLWVNYSNTYCKGSIGFCYCSLTFCFFLFHNKASRFPAELWLSAAVSVSVQVLPRRSRYRWGSLMVIYPFLHWSIWQALLLLFGICISAVWRQQKRKKKRIQKTDDCNVESCVDRCNLCLCVSQ